MSSPQARSRLAQAVLEHLIRRRDEMTELLTTLVQSESPSSDAGAQIGTQELMRAELETRGFVVRHLAGRTSGGSLFARPERRERGRALQLLLGHSDTVWPIGTLEAMPAQSTGDIFRGPGSYDMKAGLVQGLFAIDALDAGEIETERVTPLFFINSDEEIGSRESTHVIRHLARRVDRVFVLEPSLGPQGRLKTARKGIGRFTIRIFGRAAHAGLDPDGGISAILELSHVVQALFALNDRTRGITVNVGTIDGGIQPNVVAPESRAVADVRVVTHEDARRIEEAIHALQPTTPGASLEIEGAIGRPPMERTPGNALLYERAREAAEWLDLELEEATAGGGSDGNTTSLFAPTLDGLGAVGDGAHAANEHLIIQSMVQRAALLACLLAEPPLSPRSPGGRGVRA